MVHIVELEIAGRVLKLETGHLAKQADGSVLATYGDTYVLATAVASPTAKKDLDFLPLTVDYQEKAYSAGKIPGGFFRREGQPSEREKLTSRLIDRPMRPLFPEGWYYETQVIAMVISADQSGTSDVIGITAASAALAVSNIPFNGPVAAVRVARLKGQFVINPVLGVLEECDLSLVVAGTADAVMMVEGGAAGLPESVMIAAIERAHEEIKRIVDAINKLAAKCPKPKRAVVVEQIDPALTEMVEVITAEKIREAIFIPNKTARQERLDAIKAEAVDALKKEDDPNRTRHVKLAFHNLEYTVVRKMILEGGKRADGRGPTDIRAITCEVGLLPRTHGSALFTRGETQALAVVTLGTRDDEQKIDALEGEYYRNFMLHYNFPPFSVGEARPLRSPGRREIGHGALADRALKPVLPTKAEFPYTIRLVSDILESNGSSSMATVCGGSLALMDAGVPIKEPVAGIAMGLIKEGAQVMIISDILGLEDHLGDMDFKVCGTAQGVTALQMDIKIGGITAQLMEKALAQARDGRMHILERMRTALTAPREKMSAYAPRIYTIKIKPEKIREVIGPGGKVIRDIVATCGVKMDVQDDGTVTIASADEASAQKAITRVNQITEEVEIGKLYMGKVRKIMDFGAFVEVLPGVDGLVHISQLAHHRVQVVTDEVKEGDEILVKVLDVDRQGKIRLSRKEAMPDPKASEQS
ncbi:MAG: polyribonucleotide nucleotidyltransferase [Nitrospiraceae bacterium]|nr:MAG: polyribonucleotide nucleotidyltransferase [Nitrospiraceae bacterium]